MIENFKDLMQAGSEEEALLRQIDKNKIPVHVAVIMDGNGRWARQKGLKRKAGHQEGAVSAREITEYALRMGIKYLTLFAFSSENWKRPVTEVNALMNMLYENLVQQKELLVRNDIRLAIVGDIEGLPSKLKSKLVETMDFSRSHKKMQVNLALNYGARQEIVNAVKKILLENVPASKINEELFSRFLYTADCPDPDLLIRTSGELRISNFLLYQLAYTELCFTPTLWPDFRLKEFIKAILDFQNRERRFGKI
ncbi:MAG: polyprenyl diphosphate synthase [Candidatus Aminicenantes bacterium]|jgi:undecaprenyl diphosphate synthase|nr:polyprenyl diphosphate synthase [Candidatus Aminicenantes bacterium]